MRITLRLVVALVAGVALVALLFAYLQVREVTLDMRQEIQGRVATLADSLEEAVRPALVSDSQPELQRIVGRFQSREHLAGVAVVYDASDRSVFATSGVDEGLALHVLGAVEANRPSSQGGYFFDATDIRMFVYALPIQREGGPQALFRRP